MRDLGSSEDVYSSSLTGLSSQDLGTWQAGETHTYEFDVTLTGFPVVGDDLQGATARVGFPLGRGGRPRATDGRRATPEPPGHHDRLNSSADRRWDGRDAPPAPRPPADTTPPRLTLVAGKAQKLKKGSVKLKASCNEPCRTTVLVGQGVEGQGPGRVQGRASSTITVKLSKKDTKKLAKKPSRSARRRP